MKFFFRACIAILFVANILPFIPPPKAHAEPSGLTDIPIFFDNRVLSGLNSQVDSYFQVGETKRVIPGSYIDVYYTFSPTLLPDISTLTVFLDDLPIGSVKLDKTNTKKTLLRIDISHLTLDPGFHRLSFKAYLLIHDIGCVNPDNEASWAVIHNDSAIHLNEQDRFVGMDLSWYPSPFFERSSSTPLQTIIAVPDQLDQAEYNVVARLVQFFSRQGSASRIDFPIYTESDLTSKLLAENRVIWIGQPDKWGKFGKQAIDAVQKQLKLQDLDRGFIALVLSPWENKLEQLVISGNDTELDNAARIMTEEALYSQLRGAYSLLPTQPIEKDSEADLKTDRNTTLTFAYMGFDNIMIQNVKEGSATITYNLPSNWDIENGAKLKLSYSHSTSVDLDKSMMTVRVNGIPVGSRFLKETERNKGVFELDLTQEVISVRRNLEIQVNFQFINHTVKSEEEDNGCSDFSLLGNWSVIDKESTLSFTPVERTTLNLQSLPYPFVVNEKWSNTTVVLAEQPKHEQLSSLMTLIGILGRNTFDNTELNFLDLSATDLKTDVEAELADCNLIYFGDSKKLPAFMNGFDQSLVQFANEKVLSKTKNVELLNELQSNSAVVQITRSPLNPQRGLLIMTATKGGAVSLISDAYLDPVESNKIIGQFIIVDERKRVYNFPMIEPPAVQLVEQDNLNKDKWFYYDRIKEVMSGSVFILIFVLILGGLIVILWHMIRRR